MADTPERIDWNINLIANTLGTTPIPVTSEVYKELKFDKYYPVV